MEKRKYWVQFKLSVISLYFILLFSFSCTILFEKPDIVSVSLQDNAYISDINSLSSIDIGFTKQMNCYTTEKGIYIDGYNGTIHYQWTNNDTSVRLLLQDALQIGKKYILIIDTKCESSEGVNIESEKRIHFFTYFVDQIFNVVSHLPAHNGIIPLDQLLETKITIEFSEAVGVTAIKDKISITPSVNYIYEFSTDRRTLTLTCTDKLMASNNYKVKVGQALFSSSNICLQEDYEFVFITETQTTAFNITSVRMGKTFDSNNLLNIALDTSYLAKNQTQSASITKDMVFQIQFSSDVYLSSVETYINFTPYATFKLEYGGIAKNIKNIVNIYFTEPLQSETEYKVTIQKSLSSIYAKQLDKDYMFYFSINGSARPKIMQITQGSDTNIIYDGTKNPVEIIQNFSLQISSTNEVVFSIVFNKSINVFESISSVVLENSNGLPIKKITKSRYDWDNTTNTLIITFTIDPPTSSGTSIVKFTIKGEPSGVKDPDGNLLKDTVIIFAKATF